MAFVDSRMVATLPSSNGMLIGACTNYVVETDAGVLYQVYIDANSDIAFTKSTDGGKTWAAGMVVYTGTATRLSVWFDKWSGLAGGLIHCAYSENAGHDVLYRSIDTASSDALGTQTTIFGGASVANGGCLSITRTRGGNLICAGAIDAGVEIFCTRSTDVGATWGNIAAVMESATEDQIILAPGFAADDEDAMCIYWDASADEISVKFYDDSADSWSETSIATSMVDVTALSGVWPNFSIAVDLTNTYLILAAWSAYDLANADLRVWTVNESAQTEKTNVILNSTDDQGLCGVSLDTVTGDWYVFYAGATGGGQTANTLWDLYYKVSTDDGSTWGSETAFSSGPISFGGVFTNPRMVYLSGEAVATRVGPAAGTRFLLFASIEPTLPTAAQVQSGVTYGINGTQFTGTYTGSGSGNSNANILGGSVIR